MGSSILNLTQILIMMVILFRRSICQRSRQSVSDLSVNENEYCDKNYELPIDNYLINNKQKFNTTLKEKNDQNSLSNISINTLSNQRKKSKKNKNRQRVRPTKLTKYISQKNESSQQSSTHAPSSLSTSYEHLSHQPSEPLDIDTKKTANNIKKND